MQKTISVLHIIISFETGGLEKFVLDLVHATSADFKHKIVCLERIGELAESYRDLDVVSLDTGQGIQFNAVAAICSLVRANHIDIIHTHNERALFYGALAGFISRTPVVHTKHGKNSISFKSVFRNNLLSRFCNKIVAVSQDAALQCINEEHITASKVMTILNGVDTELFSPGKDVSRLKEELGIKVGIPVIGIVARLAKVKDHATLLEASHIIMNRGIDFRLLIVGDGPLMADLVAQAEALKLNEKVIFTGARHDVPDLMNVMDVFVLSSVSEGISLTLIEAMACELPVVATRVGGNPEVVIPGSTGTLVPSQTPADMATEIINFLTNQSARENFGKNGRLRACEQFGLKKAVKQYEELYRTVLKVQ